MDNHFAEMVRAVQVQLREEGLSPDADFVIISSADAFHPLVDAYFAAAIGLGADPTLLFHTPAPAATGLSDVVVQAAAQADIIIDLSSKSWTIPPSRARFIKQLDYAP